MKLTEDILHELKNGKLQFEDLNEKYLYTKKSGLNVENILILLNNNICRFEEIIDKFNLCLYKLLENKDLFEEQINGVLTQNALKYLLSRIYRDYEPVTLCFNTPLLKHILNEFVLDKKTVDKFNELIEKNNYSECYNIHTIFDLVKHYNEDDEKILKLNELNRKIYNFDLTEDQKSEIVEILRNNEQAQNTLIQIIDNNLQDQYDFVQLRNLLTKDSNKKKSKLNF